MRGQVGGGREREWLGRRRGGVVISSIWNLIYNINLLRMRFSQGNIVEKRPYAKISLKKREQLVKYVLSDNVSISKAAKRIKIKLTTARLIIKKFKETGTYPMKKFREPLLLPPPPATPPPFQLQQQFQLNKFSEDVGISGGADATSTALGSLSGHVGCWPTGLVYYYWPCYPFGTSF